MNQKKNGYNIIERIVFGIGLVVLITLISFLIYKLSKRNETPPQLHITSQYEPGLNDYTFKIEVENTGNKTAESANIKLELYQEGEMAESGTVQIQYVPVKSRETAWIVFFSERKPNDSLVVSSITYVLP